MYTQIPVKSLSKLNWLIALTCALLVFIFLVALAHGVSLAITRAIEVLALVAILSFSNLLLHLLSFDNPGSPDAYSRMRFYLASYFTAGLSWILIRFLYAYIMGERWEGEANPVMATSLAILSVFIVNTFIIVLQNLIILQYSKNKSELENLQLKANESEITNLLLRQQIHPHFLFNSLNTIKSLYRSNPAQGQEYLVHLANFLRASLSGHHSKTSLIKNEISFCLDYLEMQSIRFGDALHYSINISPATASSKYLPYFALQPLIENVLKHNDLTEKMPVRISIDEEDGYLTVSNNLQPKRFREVSTGNGLSSLKARYHLLGEADIRVDSADGFFKVRIKILEQ